MSTRTELVEAASMNTADGSIYRLTWEMVNLGEIHKYLGYPDRDIEQTPDQLIPDSKWHKVTKITADPWTQFANLRVSDTMPYSRVRNVHLEITPAPVLDWKPVHEDSTVETLEGALL